MGKARSWVWLFIRGQRQLESLAAGHRGPGIHISLLVDKTEAQVVLGLAPVQWWMILLPEKCWPTHGLWLQGVGNLGIGISTLVSETES